MHLPLLMDHISFSKLDRIVAACERHTFSIVGRGVADGIKNHGLLAWMRSVGFILATAGLVWDLCFLSPSVSLCCAPTSIWFVCLSISHKMEWVQSRASFLEWQVLDPCVKKNPSRDSV